MPADRPFRLQESFVARYRNRRPPFGFNGLGELVYMRTYSRLKDNGEHEKWYETIRRVVEGTYNIQKRWIEEHALGHWDEGRAERSAEEMYDRMFQMKFLPPGRGLWAMGTSLVEERRLSAALYNCAFISTGNLPVEDPAKPFAWMMDALMLGVGVGFDTEGAGSVFVKGAAQANFNYIIPDSREGWVESTRMLINAYLMGKPDYSFDYSQIRPAGTPIKGFGGEAAGPDLLRSGHEELRQALRRHTGSPLSVTGVVDLMNLVGKCVVAGNVRQAAQIALGSPKSSEFMDLKNYDSNPHREAYGWASNNTVYASLGMDYGDIADRIRHNGEPGLFWLDNVRAYSRMGDAPDWKDTDAKGTNPCSEQTLHDHEVCNLVEVMPCNCESIEDFKRTLKFAYLYAKTVTITKTHWPEVNSIIWNNRRIGCSLTGVTQFVAQRGLATLKQWCEEGYQEIQQWDKVYSRWYGVPRSIKTTSIKPSGTVSLLAGATPGIHYPKSRFYLRRVRIAETSALVQRLLRSGYHVEQAVGAPGTLVVEIPVDVGEGVRTNSEVSIWEQVALVAFMQKHWSDNQVSFTGTFNPDTEGSQIEHVLEHFQWGLKSVSFLPNVEVGAYAQMPYEEVTGAEYDSYKSSLTPLDFSKVEGEDALATRYCDGDTCTL